VYCEETGSLFSKNDVYCTYSSVFSRATNNCKLDDPLSPSALALRPPCLQNTQTKAMATQTNDEERLARLIVVAPTYYNDTNDIRYRLGLESCQQAAEHRIELVLVDASPSQTIRDGLEEAGCGFVRVIPQTSKGKKGAALREGIAKALILLQHNDDDCDDCENGTAVIGFQELEKVDMIRHWKSIARNLLIKSSDIVVARRDNEMFRNSYPIEQFHSEQFANMFLDSLANKIGLPSIDWTAGPVAFKASIAPRWLSYKGEVWDAQLVPIIEAFIEGAKISSFDVSYRHPESMKEQEEGNLIFNEKRLHQLNFLSDTVGKRMIEVAAAAAAAAGAVKAGVENTNSNN
jgi:hypothetical protein